MEEFSNWIIDIGMIQIFTTLYEHKCFKNTNNDKMIYVCYNLLKRREEKLLDHQRAFEECIYIRNQGKCE